MRQDFYAFAYLYQLRRGYFFEQDYYGDDSNCDSELDAEREKREREEDEAEAEEAKKKEEEEKK